MEKYSRAQNLTYEKYEERGCVFIIYYFSRKRKSYPPAQKSYRLLPFPLLPIYLFYTHHNLSTPHCLSFPINANVPAKCFTSLLHDLKVRLSPSPSRHVRMQNVSPHRPTAPRIAGNAQRPCTRVSCPLRVSLSPLPSLFLPFPCISLVFTALLISFAIARCGQKPYVKFIRIFERF